MSRTVSQSETISSNITGYDENDHEYYAISSAANGYDESGSTDYASVNLTRGSRAETYIYWEFTLPEIPSGASIDNIVCKFKARVSNSSSSYISAATIQLCSGTTEKGSSEDIRTTSTSVNTIDNSGTWTASEVNAGVRLKTTATRGTSRTSSNYYIYFYGADISITYSINGTMYEITASSNVDGISVAPASHEVFQSGSCELTITGNLGNAKVMDNDIDVTSLLVEVSGSSVETVAESQTHSGLSSGSSYAEYAVGRTAEDPYESTSSMYASSGSTGHVDYSFDFSAIPSGATIESVEVRVYGHRESSTTDSTHVANIQLMSGNTDKGTDQDFTSTSNHLITIDDPGIWTREELQNAILRFTVGYYGGCVCGITWIVNYSTDPYNVYTISNIGADHVVVIQNGQVLYIKQDGSWVAVRKAYKKINGSWVEQSDLSGLFDVDNLIVKGDG